LVDLVDDRGLCESTDGETQVDLSLLTGSQKRTTVKRRPSPFPRLDREKIATARSQRARVTACSLDFEATTCSRLGRGLLSQFAQ
jgi:hypothetical protein